MFTFCVIDVGTFTTDISLRGLSPRISANKYRNEIVKRASVRRYSYLCKLLNIIGNNICSK